MKSRPASATPCRRQGLILLASALMACLLTARASGADWVLSRAANDSRLLSLVRQPFVLNDLGLTVAQRTTIEKLNDDLDGPLMALRNWRADQAGKRLVELTTRTRVKLREVLKREQYNRLHQIIFYAHGYRAVGAGQLSKTLQVSEAQRVEIGKIQRPNDLKFNKRSQAELWADGRSQWAALRDEDRRILDLLRATQREALKKLAGPVFDRSKLTGIRVKAPEFVGKEWLNSDPITMTGLRGRVTIVHFWAFG